MLRENMKQHNELLASFVQNPVELAPVVAAKLSQIAIDLGAIGKGEVGIGLVEEIDAFDLSVDGELHRGALPVYVIVDRLGAVRAPIEFRDQVPWGRPRLLHIPSVPMLGRLATCVRRSAV